MTEPMTLEEAVRLTLPIPHREKGGSEMLCTVRMDALCVLRTHAKRTVEARRGEPEAVRRLHATDSEDAREVSIYLDTLNLTCGELMQQRDHLTTRLATTEAERDALVRAIDDAMTSAHIGVFNLGDDPKVAINAFGVWSQGIGEYFMKAERDAARGERDLQMEDRRIAETMWEYAEKEVKTLRTDRARLAAECNSLTLGLESKELELHDAGSTVGRLTVDLSDAREELARLAACVERVRSAFYSTGTDEMDKLDLIEDALKE